MVTVTITMAKQKSEILMRSIENFNAACRFYFEAANCRTVLIKVIVARVRVRSRR